MTDCTRRVFLGGLFEGVTEQDLHNRFRDFGRVSGVEIRSKRDDSGRVFNTFAYMNIFCSEASFNKCVQRYNKTNWKGCTLQIQPAKPSFLDKLREEQRDRSEREEPKPEVSQKKGVASTYARHLTPGTTLHGDQWVVTEDKKVLPIVNIRRKDKRKVIRFDPSSNPKRVKRLNPRFSNKSAKQLTWTIEETISGSSSTKSKSRKRKTRNETPPNGVDSGKQSNSVSQHTLNVDRDSDSSGSEDFFDASLKDNDLHCAGGRNVGATVIPDTDFYEVVEAGPERAMAGALQARKRTKYDSTSGESDSEWPAERDNSVSGDKQVDTAVLRSKQKTGKIAQKSSSASVSMNRSGSKQAKSKTAPHNENKSKAIKLDEMTDNSSDSDSFYAKLKIQARANRKELSDSDGSRTQNVSSEGAGPSHIVNATSRNSPKVSLNVGKSSSKTLGSSSDSDVEILTGYEGAKIGGRVPRPSLESAGTDCKMSISKDGSQKGDTDQSRAGVESRTIDVGSDSESDVPDVDSWINKPRPPVNMNENRPKVNVTGEDTRDLDSARKRVKKKNQDSTSEEGKKKKIKSRNKLQHNKDNTNKVQIGEGHLITDEFSSGLNELSQTQAPPMRSPLIGRQDRDDDGAEGDLLDVIAAEKWGQLKQFEKLARKTVSQGIATARSSSHNAPKEVTESHVDGGQGRPESSPERKAVPEIIENIPETDEQADSKHKREPKRKKSKKDGPKFKTAIERHKADNERRLESLKEKNKQSQKRSSLIKAALASVDAVGKSNKIVFGSSDEGEEEEGGVSGAEESAGERSDSETEEKKAQLFDDGDSDEEEEEEDDARFTLKQHFEGKQGRKLLALQNKIGTADERFRLDERFADDEQSSSSDDDDDDDDDAQSPDKEGVGEGESERRKALGILEGVVGHSVNKTKKSKAFKDMTMLHYDPTREDHKQFEIPEEQTPKTEKKKKKKSPVVDEPVAEIPEVSKDKYYQVSSSLDKAFKSSQAAVEKTEEQKFSLLSLFGDGGADKKPAQNDGLAETVKKTNPVFPWQQSETYDSSTDDDNKQRSSAIKQNSDDSGISDSEQVADESKTPLFASGFDKFFMTADDPRLKEGVEFFAIDKEEAVRKWEEKRPELLESYRTIRKRMLRKAKEEEKVKAIHRRKAMNAHKRGQVFRDRRNAPKGTKK